MAPLFGGVSSLEDCNLETAKRNPGPRSFDRGNVRRYLVSLSAEAPRSSTSAALRERWYGTQAGLRRPRRLRFLPRLLPGLRVEDGCQFIDMIVDALAHLRRDDMAFPKDRPLVAHGRSGLGRSRLGYGRLGYG